MAPGWRSMTLAWLWFLVSVGLAAACDADHVRGAGRGSGGAPAAAGTGGGGGAAAGTGGAPANTPPTTVVLFLVDGLMYDAVRTAAASGATNLAFVLANGVRVETSHSTSPAGVIQLPAGAPNPTPWDFASSGNVAVHTGCHLFESRQMDDIFLAARQAGIRSVFAGGAE